MENGLQHQTSTPKKMKLGYLRRSTEQFSDTLLIDRGGSDLEQFTWYAILYTF